MNKRKIFTLALAVCMIAILAVGGSLAYLFDTDAQVNVFTTGNVKIDLYEDFDNDGDGVEKLLPSTGSAQKGTLKNGVEKEVYVKNIGSELAFVRVHIAIPTLLDNGDPTFDASSNVLHFNYAPESVEEGKWNWTAKADGVTGKDGYNFYTTTVGGVSYNVYVVTYETALANGEETVDAMTQVYLDPKVTNADIERLNEALGTQWKILVVAEGSQADGFDTAYDSLNASFGVPGSYTVDFEAAAEGDTIVNKD